MRSKAITKLGFGMQRSPPSTRPSFTPTATLRDGEGPNLDRPATTTPSRPVRAAAVQKESTGEANYVASIVADKVAGLTAVYATTMALFHRERTGEGQGRVAMFRGMYDRSLVEHANGAMFDPPLGPAMYHRTIAPNRKPYRTRTATSRR